MHHSNGRPKRKKHSQRQEVETWKQNNAAKHIAATRAIVQSPAEIAEVALERERCTGKTVRIRINRPVEQVAEAADYPDHMFAWSLLFALYKNIKQRDPKFAEAFVAQVAAIRTSPDYEVLKRKRPDLVPWYVEDTIGKIDLTSLRKAHLRRTRPADAILLMRYESIFDKLKRLPKRTGRNCNNRLRSLNDLATDHEVQRCLEGAISEQEIRRLSSKTNEEIALRMVSWPYRSEITPGTLRKTLSMARKAAAQAERRRRFIEDPRNNIFAVFSE